MVKLKNGGLAECVDRGSFSGFGCVTLIKCHFFLLKCERLY